MKNEAEELYEIAVRSLKPCSIHRETEISSFTADRESVPTVAADNILFKGNALIHLKNIKKIYPYITSCGIQLEELDYSKYDFLAPYWIDILKEGALRDAHMLLKEYMRENYKLKRSASLNPGSGNVDIWPIEELRCVFSLLGGSGETGVKLTESCLMLPNKTMSGLFFDAETDYESCSYCNMENCPDRRALYKEDINYC